MLMVNMHKAKTTLSQLVEAALAGEEVVISRRGKPAVQIIPIQEESAVNLRPIGLGVDPRAPKTMTNLADFSVAEDFNSDDDPNDPLNW
ncbi:MAG: type II toxin-antitoxin system prevent-host-death family antitoxin [Ignavibacteriae bacterium]|nr:MAG: type II toxin-antitoxin system prevent-host-death family antitoxin [Ignavibacteriota bacterium]